MAETQLFPPEQLFEFSVRVFEHFGVPEDGARTAATVLQAADLRGIDSHGVARLHTYFDMLQLGRIGLTEQEARAQAQIVEQLRQAEQQARDQAEKAEAVAREQVDKALQEARRPKKETEQETKAGDKKKSNK